ncbi:ESX-1 secretion-associated protein [Nocardia mangyaensis]|uniref:ESX-1 secretion-associated protein n=1 Tax=Nocardia mangyaensis TaxID=2213200 RepID=A0A1J0VUT6_9NOCA|nr:type VII secretion target [Nocardia mangyaensis]APE35761.1 ESX-1 secretion-associated protein [Nocardia mangyaensis]MDO3646689.1 type VII secretion target [Nocardia mangyaensis]
MTDLSVQTDAVAAFAATNSVVAADVSAAGLGEAAASVTAMTPVFGLIGADYLAMFAAAQALQAKDINDLSDRFSKLSDAAFTSSVQFETTDLTNAADIARRAAGIGGLA